VSRIALLARTRNTLGNVAQACRLMGVHRSMFATYQSSLQIATAYRDKTPQFDLAIADEAQRCAGHASSQFAAILDSSKIRSRRRAVYDGHAAPLHATRAHGGGCPGR
jgi:predicted helicase